MLLRLLFACFAVALQCCYAQQQQEDRSSIALYGGSKNFRVVVISETLSVVCTNSVTISCQAVEIRNSNQTLIGLPKEVATYQDFLDLELAVSNNGEYIVVCYSTYTFGSKCTTVGVDPHFGLLQNEQQIFVCPQDEICQQLALAALPDRTNKTFALCYAGVKDSYCNLLTVERSNNAQQSLVTKRLLTAQAETWSSTSLFVATDTELMHCAVLLGAFTQPAKCRLITISTMQFITTRQMDNIAGVTVVSGAYLGKMENIQFSIICYLQQRTMTCQVVSVDQGVIRKASQNSFPAQYGGLDGLRIQSLTDHKQGERVLSCMICFSSMEDSSELICTMATIVGASGTLQLDPYEMVVDEDGFYFQNVEEALRATEVVGGYLEKSLRPDKDSLQVGGAGDQQQSSRIADITVLPDFFGTFNQTDNHSSIASMGCINVGFHDFDQARYCVGTRTKIAKLTAQPSLVIPPEGYCNVQQTWECAARGDKCLLYTVAGRAAVCASKYDCTVPASSTKAACELFASQGALCKWENSSCQPSYDWDSETMCPTIKVESRCQVPGLNCGWFAGACYALPYCSFPMYTDCVSALGCVWVGRRCGRGA